MKTVSSKLLILALALFVYLGAAGTAQAYAIYNHVDHAVCVNTFWHLFVDVCEYTIPAHGKHNGGHGDSLSHVYVSWRTDSKMCRGNVEGFSIPKGGYARIYDGEVKVYKHDGKHVESKSTTKGPCTQ